MRCPSTTKDLTGVVEGFPEIDSTDPDLPLARAMVACGLLSTDGEGRFRPVEPGSR
jgi:hypothetical protein